MAFGAKWGQHQNSLRKSDLCQHQHKKNHKNRLHFDFTRRQFKNMKWEYLYRLPTQFNCLESPKFKEVYVLCALLRTVITESLVVTLRLDCDWVVICLKYFLVIVNWYMYIASLTTGHHLNLGTRTALCPSFVLLYYSVIDRQWQWRSTAYLTIQFRREQSHANKSQITHLNPVHK